MRVVSSSSSVLFELAFDVGQGELGCVDGNLELAQNPGQAADVVLVAVGEDDGADMLPVFNEVGDVGDDDVDAEQLRLGEHEAGVDDDNVVFPAEGEAVHAEFAEAAEGNDFQFFRMHLSGLMLTLAGFCSWRSGDHADRGRIPLGETISRAKGSTTSEVVLSGVAAGSGE